MNTHKKAFTLIELLVVIAIIALLLSILMPALSRVKGIAKSVVCRAHVRQYVVTNQMYASSNDDEMVHIWWIANRDFWSGLGVGSTQIDEMLIAWNDGVNPDYSEMVLMKDLICPAADKKKIASDQAYPFTYAYNIGGLDWNANPMPRKKISQVRGPSDKISFIDSSDMACNGMYSPFTEIVKPTGASVVSGVNYPEFWNVVGDYFGLGGGGAPGAITSRWYHGLISYRHSEGASLAMVDGHVESRKKEEVWILMDDGITANYRAMASMWDLYGEQMQ